MLKKVRYILIFCCLMGFNGLAQELNCKVTILHDKITGVDGQVFSAMQKSITEFLNTHKWTNDEYTTIE